MNWGIEASLEISSDVPVPGRVFGSVRIVRPNGNCGAAESQINFVKRDIRVWEVLLPGALNYGEILLELFIVVCISNMNF